MWWPAVVLILIVAGILVAERRRMLQPIFRWLPVPLWCYALPMVATTLGWLPSGHPAYPLLIQLLLPFALGLLLFGVDLASVLRMGWRVLAATALGGASIILGAPVVAWALHHHLPPEAWKGVGTLAATWTGGSMNLLAMKTILDTPEAIFTSLIVVDALIAYSWMALLVGLSKFQTPVDRWLRARPLDLPSSIPSADDQACTARDLAVGGLCSLVVTAAAQQVASRLPTNVLVHSRSGWVVLLVTTLALCGSLLGPIRRLGRSALVLGYPCLYVVLAAMGAQASFAAVRSAPVWVAVGVGIALLHGFTMLIGGRWLRLPLGVLATASQANLGGVASTPLVGAVYDTRLAPIGLLLAIGLNAVGTYLGLCAALVARLFLGGG